MKKTRIVLLLDD